MKNIVFNEKRDIEKIISSGKVKLETVFTTIGSMAKYNLYELGMSDEENKQAIANWLKEHYSAYVETEYDSIINDKIKKAHKYKLIYSEDLLIYQPELDTISQVDNVRMEKVLFVLLCVAKLQRNMLNYQNGKYKMSLTNIFKLARVHIQSVNRDMFMHQLFKDGYINAPYTTDGEERWVNYICEEGEPVIRINELDFEELAYTYLNWKNKGGFKRCEKCGRMIKTNKNNTRKYCEECAKETEKINSKERVKRFRSKCNEDDSLK